MSHGHEPHGHGAGHGPDDHGEHGHEHGHDHGHEDGHDHRAEDGEHGAARPTRHYAKGTVVTGEAVLDIGGDIGALILYTDPAYVDREIEVSPVDDDGHRTHTAIHERRLQGRAVFAGVYPQLLQGTYRIWGDDPALPDRVTIVGGEVAEIDWRTPED